MNTHIETSARYGYGFIGAPFLPSGEDEFYLRNRQIEQLYPESPRRRAETYRLVSQAEIRALEAQGNRCAHWEDFWVRDPFDPRLIRDSFFAGRVRLGAMEEGLLRFHDYVLPIGVVNSRIISCDIGDNPAIHDCRYISHYIVGDGVILSSIHEMDTTNHAKFGEGILKEGESEDVRIWIEPLNESGGRGILPFHDLIPADAYLWTVYREDRELMDAFLRITQTSADSRRGYYGTVGHGTVIKHCLTIKDVRIGAGAYIKGANKLKNLSIKSDFQEPTQIGEGVELVNGIVGYGCRIFYGCKAVRFVLGNNCNLKYGARLIHSILGDNSTVSCCEVLNNLVFPAHEQHHNNSFLIATMILGQSNMAAGATVGSNHNSRGNDGEIIAGRGFWPGLSSTLKHNCRFASYVLIAKGNYPAELNIPLPFSLLTNNAETTRRELMPAYWWRYNMYALERNSWKTRNRDKRIRKVQHIESDYLAPDTVREIVDASALLEEWTGKTLLPPSAAASALRKAGRSMLADETAGPITLMIGNRCLERSNQEVKIIKPREGYRAYREMLLYYGVKTLLEFFEAQGIRDFAAFQDAHPEPVSFNWVNLGGQLAPEAKADALRDAVRQGKLKDWTAIHGEYRRLREEYPLDKALNALKTLSFLAETESPAGTAGKISPERWDQFIRSAVEIRRYIEAQVYKTKLKDYADPFRAITYRNAAERDAVLGSIEDNPFVKTARKETADFIALAEKMRISFQKMC
ncbi:MAG: DUF4954 family protein [Spirochaetaceae bacterium]|jgi:NDP-sugar pyrophosphorylase family protein|nr:DUF4954 family protein [Spirochaetaceae bacterium]